MAIETGSGLRVLELGDFRYHLHFFSLCGGSPRSIPNNFLDNTAVPSPGPAVPSLHSSMSPPPPSPVASLHHPLSPPSTHLLSPPTAFCPGIPAFDALAGPIPGATTGARAKAETGWKSPKTPKTARFWGNFGKICRRWGANHSQAPLRGPVRANFCRILGPSGRAKVRPPPPDRAGGGIEASVHVGRQEFSTY